jgi:hypothetical protein
MNVNKGTKMKETIIQEPIELRFGNEASMIMDGKKVVQTEELVKINVDGDQALLRFMIPAELAMEKTFKITIKTYDDQILENDFQNKDYLNN